QSPFRSAGPSGPVETSSTSPALLLELVNRRRRKRSEARIQARCRPRGGCHSNPMCEQCVPFDGRLESPSCLMLSEDQANVDPLRAGLQHCELLASSKTHVSPLLRMFDDASNSQCCRSEEHTSELQSR